MIFTKLYVSYGSIHINIIYFFFDALHILILLWGVMIHLIKRVKIPLLRMIVFLSNFSIFWKNIITWWCWPIFIILVFRVYPFNLYWFTSGYFLAHVNPPSDSQDYISYYPSQIYYLFNIGNIITYQSWIFWPISNHLCFLRLILQLVCDCNIWSCHVLLNIPWLWNYWWVDPTMTYFRLDGLK